MRGFLAFILLFIALALPTSCTRKRGASVADFQNQGLLERLLADRAGQFVMEQIPADNTHDVFELESVGDKITIRGNNGLAIARGLNHYLRSYCHTSARPAEGPIHLPAVLPSVPQKERVSSPYAYRYYLNYCTYSYTMPFWDWARWEKEIDWMAMQGINMPLAAVVGQHAVWQHTLRRLGYSDQEILSFLPGAGYEAWWLMGNLEGTGGPVTQAYIDDQLELQRKILARMREYGMEPVLQGFFGMVPESLINKKPSAGIRDTGNWLVYQRPAFLDPTDPAFAGIAAIYYEEQEKLLGKANYFGGDPFHEGGIHQGVQIPDAAAAIAAAMKKAAPESIWILQGWQQNPTSELLAGLQPDQALIIDLMACTRPQWGGIKESLFYKKEGHGDFRWIWSALPNFGGRVGLYGRLFNYANDPVAAKASPLGRNMAGIGIAPEGSGTNPVSYDLLFDMGWTNQPINVNEWLVNYARYRYGRDVKTIDLAWQKLVYSVYNCPTQEDGPQESFFCARPDREIRHVSSWGTALLYYNPQDLVEAWENFLLAKTELKESDAYRYDLVDITRQVLADYGKYVHKKVIEAYDKRDRKAFDQFTGEFLQLILDQDRLLATRKEFMLGPWLQDARRTGTTEAEKDRFEENARTLLTTWAATDSELHDYAHREWAGLLNDFYLPRWQQYFAYLSEEMQGNNVKKPDFFSWEQAWTARKNPFPSEPQGNAIEIAAHLYQRYHTSLKKAYNP